MFTFILVFIVFSILIIVHELGHMVVARKAGVRVERFSLGFGKKVFGIKRGNTEYILSIFPFGGYVKLAGDDPRESKGGDDEFFSKSPFKRFCIIAAGSLTNYIFAFLLFSIIFMIGLPARTTYVGKLIAGYPALAGGLKEGDLIVAIDGNKVKYWNELLEAVGQNTEGRGMDFTVERDKRSRHFEITPKIIKTKNIFKQETTVGKIGIYPREDFILVKHNPIQAVTLGGKHTFMLTGMTYKGLWLLLTGGLPVRESVTGPIGIAVLIGAAAKVGIVSLLMIMAHINVALAIFNLLPFPVLDGGHILFIAIEKLRGRPLSVKTQEVVSQVALYMLVTFALFVCWNDITKFFGR